MKEISAVKIGFTVCLSPDMCRFVTYRADLCNTCGEKQYFKVSSEMPWRTTLTFTSVLYVYFEQKPCQGRNF